MTPQEWWRLHAVKQMSHPRGAKREGYAGTLSETDCEELYELIDG